MSTVGKWILNMGQAKGSEIVLPNLTSIICSEQWYK